LYIYNGSYFEPLDNIPATTLDTTSLSNRIDARVKYSDTAAMLAPYYRTATAVADLALKQNLVSLTTTGSSGNATFNQSTGALNIPNYTFTQTPITATYPLSVTGGTPQNVSIDTGRTPGQVATAYAQGKIEDSLGSLIVLKQNQLNGTGFVKSSGTTISYDNSTYLTTETDPVARAINGILYSNGSALSAAIPANFPTLNQNTTGSAATLTTPRTIGTITGDATSAGSSFNGSANNTNALTFATVNSNVGSFGSATQSGTFTVNGKGLITAASSVTVTPAISSVTGLGTGVATFLATPTSANFAAAITNETGGGGLVVLNNSPTIITPLLTSLTSGTTNDSLVVVDATTGQTKRISPSRISGGGGSTPTLDAVMLTGNTSTIWGQITSSANTTAFPPYTPQWVLKAVALAGVYMEETTGGVGWFTGLSPAAKYRIVSKTNPYSFFADFGDHSLTYGLHMTSTAPSTGFRLQNQSSGGNDWYVFSTGLGLGAPVGSLAYYSASSGYAFTMTDMGNVSIGAASPAAGLRLDVNGNFRSTNAYTNAASVSAVYGTGAGASSTPTSATVAGNNQVIKLTITPSASPAAGSIIATFTFSGAFAYPNGCAPSAPGAGNTSSVAYVGGGGSAVWADGTATTVVLRSPTTTALVAGTTYIFHITVNGY